MHAPMPGQPGLHLGVRMGAVVVDDDVELSARVGPRDLFEEVEELLVAVALVAGVGDPAGGDLEGREQGGGAVARVVVGGALGKARARHKITVGRETPSRRASAEV